MFLLLLFRTYLAHKRKPGREGGERGREAAWFLNALEASGRQACGGRGGARQLRLPLLVGFRSEGTKAPGRGQREPEGAARGGGRGPTTAAAPPPAPGQAPLPRPRARRVRPVGPRRAPRWGGACPRPSPGSLLEFRPGKGLGDGSRAGAGAGRALPLLRAPCAAGVWASRPARGERR